MAEKLEEKEEKGFDSFFLSFLHTHPLILHTLTFPVKPEPNHSDVAMIFSNLLSTLLFFVLAGVAFARPAPRFLELNRRAAPTDGIFGMSPLSCSLVVVEKTEH